jgi:hypothetical protein
MFLTFIVSDIVSEHDCSKPTEFSIRECADFVKKSEAAFYNKVNKMSEEKSWLWWLFPGNLCTLLVFLNSFV